MKPEIAQAFAQVMLPLPLTVEWTTVPSWLVVPEFGYVSWLKERWVACR